MEFSHWCIYFLFAGENRKCLRSSDDEEDEIAVLASDVVESADVGNDQVEEKKNGTEHQESAVFESLGSTKQPGTDVKQKKFGIKALEYVMEKVPSLRTRRGRAGLVPNFLRGVGLKAHVHPAEVDATDSTDALTTSFVSENTKKKKIELIDAGLQFNSPYPPVLRPEREVDLILSFDFSARDSDDVPPFKVRLPLLVMKLKERQACDISTIKYV